MYSRWKSSLVLLGWILLLMERIVETVNLANMLEAPETLSEEGLRRRDFYGNRLLPLGDLTQSKKSVSCPDGLIAIRDVDTEKNRRAKTIKIPFIIHQTSKSRCLAPELANLVQRWQELQGFDYFLHTDEAVNFLLAQQYPEFPTLADVVHCIRSPTLKADLWRYLVLWDYGGVYVDLDSIPNDFQRNPISTIQSEEDGFFVVDHYHYLSQYFMALSPRHPLMFYTIQASLANVLLASDTGSINPARTTGPAALHRGLQSFVLDAGMDLPDALTAVKQQQRGPVVGGIYKGTNGLSIRVVETEDDNQVVRREALKRAEKMAAYSKMGMKHFSKTRQASNVSCLALLYDIANNHTGSSVTRKYGVGILQN
jgi:Glycosyltransferase sugar-binding region containing DXD motif